MKYRIKFSWKKFASFIAFNILFAMVLAPFILFWGPFQALKVMAVGSVENSRHPQVVRFFLSQAKIDQIIHQNDSSGINDQPNVVKVNVVSDPGNGITIENIQGHNFKGKVMLIRDPKRVKVAVTKQLGVTGERVSDFVRDMNAIAGINAGGFYDPNGKGNGAFPDGLTVHNGQLVHNNVGNLKVNIVGLDDKGKLVIGDMSADELAAKHIQEAVTFEPNLIVNGKPVISGDGGWGVAPRTGIGQTADGTIIFVVIDGRQPTWSWGATLRDLMNVFVEYHAVNAVNLDGGSSSEIVYQGKVINRLWDIFGERYIPTGFVVLPK
ncbi:MAG: phosphodiester glycosidase family protein [Desulfitobacteriaceae bacterium]